MKRTLLVTFTLISSISMGTPHYYAEQIKKSCSSRSAPDNLNPLSRLLEETQSRYKNQEERVENPRELVLALDRIIAQSEFAEILKCRESANLKGLSYRLAFQDPSKGDDSMAVSQSGSALTLEFNLTKSVQRVLFVYIHELTHVCQAAAIQNASTQAEYNRNDILREIEAFYKMQLAYRYFTKFSSRLCKAEGTGSDDGDEALYESYVAAEYELEAGTFAQQIVAGYIEDYKGHEGDILNLTSKIHTYKVQSSEETFQLNSLHPDLKKKIEKLGIKVVEPESAR